MVGNMCMSEIYRITIREDVENDPPLPLIRSPREGGKYSVGSLIYFDAVGTTDDGEENPDHLTYSWVSDRTGLLGTGINISLRMSKGDHTVTLYVSDGTQGHNVSKAVNFTVVEPYVPENPQGSEEDDSKEGAWAWIVVAITAVLLLITGLVLLASYRRSRGVEYRMDVGSDPEDYNSETGSEERGHQEDEEM